jgi:hypothetical protein
MQELHNDVHSSLVLLGFDGRLNGSDSPVVTDHQLTSTKDMVATAKAVDAWRDDVGAEGEMRVGIAGVGSHVVGVGWKVGGNRTAARVSRDGVGVYGLRSSGNCMHEIWAMGIGRFRFDTICWLFKSTLETMFLDMPVMIA